MSDIRITTESLINKSRFVFIVFFILAGISSYRGGSGVWSWGAIFASTFVFLIMAIINQVYIKREIFSNRLVVVSVTIEFLLIFVLKFSMHFVPVVGYGMTMKEPATFLVYFLFMVMNALRYNKKLILYAGGLSLFTYSVLLLLAIFHGGMEFTKDVTKFFASDTLRVSAEFPKIIFLMAFTYFLYRMADFTTGNIKQLKITEDRAQSSVNVLKEVLKTVHGTSDKLIEGSLKLSDSAKMIDDILNKNGELMKDVNSFSGVISQGVEIIKDKTGFQYKTVEDNFEKIKDISALMEKIYNDSTLQNKKAEDALKLSELNKKNINSTINTIGGMKEDSQKIEEISKTISDIADQTSLLSLNAAIESARAGEHGKGFAVVAEEISKLAEMSIESSKEIAMIISNTVNNIDNASTMIETLSGYLRHIVEFVNENHNFMENLNINASKELEESKILVLSSVEVEKAAKEVLESAEKQEESMKSIGGVFKQIYQLGFELSENIDGLKILSLSLNDNADEIRDVLNEEKIEERDV